MDFLEKRRQNTFLDLFFKKIMKSLENYAIFRNLLDKCSQRLGAVLIFSKKIKKKILKCSQKFGKFLKDSVIFQKNVLKYRPCMKYRTHRIVGDLQFEHTADVNTILNLLVLFTFSPK